MGQKIYLAEAGVQFEMLTCSRAECSVLWMMPTFELDRRRNDGKSFYCPHGHSQAFCETEADRLRKQVAKATSEADQARASADSYRKWLQDEQHARRRAERRVSATKGVVTRLKNRVGRGLCPCCDTEVPDLKNHMAEAHPEYHSEGYAAVDEDAPEVEAPTDLEAVVAT